MFHKSPHVFGTSTSIKSIIHVSDQPMCMVHVCRLIDKTCNLNDSTVDLHIHWEKKTLQKYGGNLHTLDACTVACSAIGCGRSRKRLFLIHIEWMRLEIIGKDFNLFGFNPALIHMAIEQALTWHMQSEKQLRASPTVWPIKALL